ncbi:YkgJ family cysteine cluster protein [Conchiformibius kuhniae]|uniref:YkgJ family cysteine cluster protein n=1 Tax=Conchiformibius kuhniae TaxID=211502 RepID=A0A8T9MVM0_9NEIS|nr:YkgJ family cysteine cluster protein [Conchiformibius kuhniae]UOP04516.1 YkgJ family cysteine cluster protein [Conchiformibius kuhniae]
MNKPFPCTACGLCCRRVHLSDKTAWLNRGDGVCRHLDGQTNLCRIYAQRPLVCRVEDYYHAHFAEQFDWEEFVKINVAICELFQRENEAA